MLDFDVIEAKEVTPKKAKGKKAKVVEQVVVEAAPAAVEEAPAKKSKKAKSSKKQEEAPVEEVVEEVVEEAAEPEEVEEDDQTAALLAGFSDDDESDSDNDIAFDEDVQAPVLTLTKSQRKALKKAKDTPRSDEPGVVYVGYVLFAWILHSIANHLI
jgi:nucleolar protein 15